MEIVASAAPSDRRREMYPYNVEGAEPRERERHVILVLVRLEHADQVARLRPVELDRVGAAATGLDLLLVELQEKLQRFGQRRGPRGSVIGIGASRPHWRATRSAAEGSRHRVVRMIISNRRYSPFIFNYQGGAVLPAESVYAVLEAKQAINAAESIRRVRRIRLVPRMLLHRRCSFTHRFREPARRSSMGKRP